MARLRSSERGYADEPEDHGLPEAQMTSPMVFVWTMVIFLIIVAFVGAILFRQAHAAFLSKSRPQRAHPRRPADRHLPVLSAMCLVFAPKCAGSTPSAPLAMPRSVGREPVLLAPMRALIGRHSHHHGIFDGRAALDPRFDRHTAGRDPRYLALSDRPARLSRPARHLLGPARHHRLDHTVIQSLDAGTGSTDDVLSALKTGLSAPLTGMGTAFSTSLFGLASSLILGFLDLQAGRAQSRFYTELENWLSSVTDVEADRAVAVAGGGNLEEMRDVGETAQPPGAGFRAQPAHDSGHGQSRRWHSGLVKNMRGEQQMLRDWIEAQQEESRAMRSTLEGLINRLAERGSAPAAPPRMPAAPPPQVAPVSAPAPAPSAARAADGAAGRCTRTSAPRAKREERGE